jgi:hypothetical protein
MPMLIDSPIKHYGISLVDKRTNIIKYHQIKHYNIKLIVIKQNINDKQKILITTNRLQLQMGRFVGIAFFNENL